MGSAQPGLTAGGEAVTGCHRAGSKARPGLGRRVSVVAADVGGHALAPPAPEPVAAQAQFVSPDGSFEAGDPAHTAAPVTGTVLRARSQRGEGVDAGFFARLEAGPAAAAHTASVPCLGLAASDAADA